MRPPEPPSPDYLARQWQRLHAWVASATRAFDGAPQHVTRSALAPLLGWLHILEAMLRRLVLIAASSIILAARPTPTRHTHTRKPIERRCNVSFRLIAFHREQQTDRKAHTTAPASSTPTRQPAFFAWKTDSLLTARNNFHVADNTPAHPRHTTRARLLPQTYDDGPLIPPYEPRHTGILARPPATAAQNSTRQPGQTTTPLANFLARLQHVASLIAAPDALIQRAARRLTRLGAAQRFALAQCPPPHPQTRMRSFTGEFLPLIDAHFKTLSRIGLHANTS